MNSDKEYFSLYKQLVATKFQLGENGGSWKQRDIEYLASLVEEKSGIRLSLSTMKRLWKEDFVKMPHPNTLNALVSVLDYKDWQTFKIKNANAAADPSMTPQRPKTRILLVSIGIILIGGVVVLILPGFLKSKALPVIKGEIRFSANKTVTTGVPNTVIFSYDVQNVESDSFMIQQSWNEKERVRIDPNENYFSRIYYYPGFHRAKLIANDSIIRKSRIHIKTDGWEPLVSYNYFDPVPVYIKGSNIVHDGMLKVQQEDVKRSGVNSAEQYLLSYFNIRDYEDVNSDNFFLDMKLKCDSTMNYACPGFTVTILTEEHIFNIPMTTKGCVSTIEAKIGEKYFNGNNSNMAVFGGNVYDWQHIELEVVDKNTVLSVNDKIILETTFKQDFGKIVGLVARFTGLASMDFVRLGNSREELIYVEDFE